jgi:hypothetical protein
VNGQDRDAWWAPPLRIRPTLASALEQLGDAGRMDQLPNAVRPLLRRQQLVETLPGQLDPVEVRATQLGRRALAAWQEWQSDPRRWWLLGAQAWPTVHMYEGVSNTFALAAYRQDLVDAERDNGMGRESAERAVRAAGLRSVAGPYPTSMALDVELGWDLAVAACNRMGGGREYPDTPARPEEVALWVSAGEVAERRCRLEQRYRQRAGVA